MKTLETWVICGITHEVFEATPEEEPELNEENGDTNAGCCRPWEGKIFVREGQSPSAARSTIEHEIYHCRIYHSGLKYILQRVMKLKNYDEVEETIVQLLTVSYAKKIT